jgi:ribonuclease HI
LNLDAASNSTSSTITPSKFYAVASGHRPGIYTDWPSAQKQITGWTKPKHKSFSSRAEAEQYLRNVQAEKDASPTIASTSDGSELVSDGSLPSKRVKMSDGFTSINGDNEDLPKPGTDPLPPGTEDGFDDRIILDPSTGKVRWKTPAEFAATTPQARVDNKKDTLYVYTDGACRANGQQGSVGGVGVFFGDNDPRYTSQPQAPSLPPPNPPLTPSPLPSPSPPLLPQLTHHPNPETCPSHSEVPAKRTSAPNSPPSNAHLT